MGEHLESSLLSIFDCPAIHQVLRNIFGPVTLEPKQQNAAVPLRSIRRMTDKEDSNLQIIASDEYDFLRPKSPSSTPKARFDDLPSVAVSRLVHGGLVFWGPKGDLEDSDPPGIAEPHDTSHSNLVNAISGQECEGSTLEAEATSEHSEGLSARGAETDGGLPATDWHSTSELEKPKDDMSCLVA
jgi:hypothetical protein